MNKRTIKSTILIFDVSDKEKALQIINDNLTKHNIPLYEYDADNDCFKMDCFLLTDEQINAIDLFCPGSILSSSIALAAAQFPSATMKGKLFYADAFLSEIAMASYDGKMREMYYEYAHEGDAPACPSCNISIHDFSEMYELEEIYLPEECPFCGERLHPEDYWYGDYCYEKFFLTDAGWVRMCEIEY